MLGEPDTVVTLGVTELPFDMVMDHIQELNESQFRPEKYHLLEHNCNTFSSEFAQFLTGVDIPEYVTNLPSEVLSTPFGQMIKPFVDAMSVSPGGTESRVFSREQHGQSPAATSPSAAGEQAPYLQMAAGPQVSDNGGQTRDTSGRDKLQEDTTSAGVAGSAPTGVESVKCDCTISAEDIALLSSAMPHESGVAEELGEYLTTSPTDWSIGRAHVSLCVTVCLDENATPEVRLVAMTALQCLAVESRSANTLQNAGGLDLLALCLAPPPSAEFSAARLAMLCNMCYSPGGALPMLTTREPVLPAVQELCVSGLLQGDQAPLVPAASLALNLSLEEASHEVVAVPLVCAIVERLNSTEPSEEAVFLMLSALVQFAQYSSQIKDLLGALDRQWLRHGSRSDRLEMCCSKLS